MPTELKVIMFTDQVGFTPKTEKRTYAEILQVDRAQNELTVKAVSLCRGRIVNPTGDGHMIEFDACSDAVRCGHLIQQYVAERNGTTVSENLKFSLHIGIDFGQVLVLENKDIRAKAANQAARVSSNAPEGKVYFTEKVKNELHEREAVVEFAGNFPLKGVDENKEVALYCLKEWLEKIEASPNPFVWRDGITTAEGFFGRERETKKLRDYFRGKQNCQIVGERRIGKTSLLRHVERVALEWNEKAIVAYLDLQDARCHTRSGLLKEASKRFHWKEPATDMALFSENVEEMTGAGLRPVLCIDEFEGFVKRSDEFNQDFLIALRSCGQNGLCIFTSSKKPLYEVTNPKDDTSAYFNTFPLMRLDVFTQEEAEKFVNEYRLGIKSFTEEEKKEILSFAKHHPLALQVACYYVVDARDANETLTVALRRAEEEMKAMLLTGW